MTIPRILNCFCYLGVFTTSVVTGALGYDLSHLWTYLLNSTLPGRSYPDITDWVLVIAQSPAYFFANLALGLLFFVVLFVLEFSQEKRRAFTSSFLAAALMFNFVQLAIIFWALCKPFMYVTWGMSAPEHHP